MSDDVTTQQAQGENTRVLKNGAVYDMNTKRIVSNPGGGPTTAITQTNAVALAKKRWSDYYAEAESGLARAAQVETPTKAWGYIVQNMAKMALADDPGRAGVEAARFVRDSLGLSQQSDDNHGGVQLNVSSEAMELILQAVLEWRNQG